MQCGMGLLSPPSPVPTLGCKDRHRMRFLDGDLGPCCGGWVRTLLLPRERRGWGRPPTPALSDPTKGCSLLLPLRWVQDMSGPT